MDLMINRSTNVTTDLVSEPVKRAMESLLRDIRKVFLPTDEKGCDIYLRRENQERECFVLKTTDRGLTIGAADDLGFIYGIFEVSRSLLGISDFWFWNDQRIHSRKEICLSEEFSYQSQPFCVKLRGWFINDEVLLHAWSVERNKDKPWEMVFEALLRLGGNIVIPGTDKNASYYRKLAADMGLMITHHHAEPLGAEMFSRKYPRLNPFFDEHNEKFINLWKEGIQNQKELNVVWNLGFRGQGDCPFWNNDPRYRTSASRGKLMSQLIRNQYDMVKEEEPNAVCCTYLYGETMELYRDGFLKIPEDVNKIRTDNGYGKMVTRRQGNHNPRIRALPDGKDKGKHGIYYHVSFYDLQASNHITMLPHSPEFVQKELGEVLDLEMNDYWIVNVSNTKPHVYFLDLIADIWRNGKINWKKHQKTYIARYYGGENVHKVSRCYDGYFKNVLAYGKNEDEHAGGQFANHTTRILISQFMKEKKECAKQLLWATDGDNLKKQILWYRQLCTQAPNNYKEYLEGCERVALFMKHEKKRLFEDSLLLQAKIYCHCFEGAFFICEALLYGYEKNYQKAFYYAGRGKCGYKYANRAMRECEHGKWQREFLYSEEDRKVMLILNMENHLNDAKLFKFMKAKWGD